MLLFRSTLFLVVRGLFFHLCFYTVFSNFFRNFCLYVFMLPSDSSPPPLAPFDHRIVTPKPHQIATYYTINRDEVLGGWVRRVNHSSQAYFYSHSHFYTSVVSNEITEDLTPCEATPNSFFPRPYYCPLKGRWLWALGGNLRNSRSDVIDQC